MLMVIIMAKNTFVLMKTKNNHRFLGGCFEFNYNFVIILYLNYRSNFVPKEALTTFFAGIVIGFFVDGLKPFLAFLSTVLRVI